MGNQITLAVPDIKPSLIVEVLTAYNSRNFKISFFVPANALALIQPFTVLFFIQNAKQLIPKCKTQIRKLSIKPLIIKGWMLGKINGERDAVGLFPGKCFRLLPFGHDHLQMVVRRVFLELFLEIIPAELFVE